MGFRKYSCKVELLSFSLLLSLVILVAACAPSKTTPFQELDVIPQGKAVIYIYRGSQANHPTMVGGNARVIYKGETLAWFPYGGYYPLIVSPGEIEIRTNSDSVTIDVKAGGTYFLRVNSRHVGLSSAGHFIGPVPDNEAREDLAYCQLLDIKER